MPKWTVEQKEAARLKRAAEDERSRLYFQRRDRLNRLHEVRTKRALISLANPSGELVQLRREVFVILAQHAIDHATDFRPLPLVAAMMLTEFRELLPPKLARDVARRFGETVELREPA